MDSIISDFGFSRQSVTDYILKETHPTLSIWYIFTCVLRVVFVAYCVQVQCHLCGEDSQGVEGA